MAVITAEPRTVAPAPRPPRRRKAKHGPFRATWLTYVILAVVFLVSVFPFYWTIVAASTSNTEINHIPPNLVPGENLFKNFGCDFPSVGFSFSLERLMAMGE